MAETRRESDQDFKIELAARELGIAEATLRHWRDAADDQELMDRAVGLIKAGKEIENVARNLGIDLAALRSRVHAEWERKAALWLQHEEEMKRLRNRPPVYLENPPS